MTAPNQALWDALMAAGVSALQFSLDGNAVPCFGPTVTSAQITTIEAVITTWQENPTAPSWTLYQQEAAAALKDSDITMLRCGENQVAVPAAWATYRKALRTIVGATTPGDPTQPLPTRPAYPAGT